jgi:hypothetical protein
MYSAGLQESLTHTDIISTDATVIIEEVYRSGVTAMKCHLKTGCLDQWRSKKFGKLQNLFEIKDSEADIEELPIITDVQRLISKMPRHQCNDIV